MEKAKAIVDLQAAKTIGEAAISPPSNYGITEEEKYANGGAWFAQYGRWIVSNFYNQRRDYVFNESENNVNGIADNAYLNWSYVFGMQPNNSYKYAESTMDSQAIPAPWIPGQKISSLVNHLEGRLLEDISDLRVTASNLTRDVTSKRAEMYEKMILKYETQSIANSFPPGAEFSPVDVPRGTELSSMEDIKDFTTKWQDKYSIMAERIARSQLSSSSMAEKFKKSGVQTFVNNLTGMYTYVDHGKVLNKVIPAHEAIWDNRVDSDHNDEAMFAGFVKQLVPYQEIIRRFSKNMRDEDILEIENLAKEENLSNSTEWYGALNFLGNSRCNGFDWWSNVGTQRMALSYAKIFFIAPRDFRYKKGNNSFGQPRVYKINENTAYRKMTDGEKYSIDGSSMQGDYKGMDLYSVTVVGNKYMVDYGLVNNVLRDYDDVSRPILPIKYYCPGMELGFGRSIVDRLRLHQDNLDYIQNKIIDKFSKDYGKVTFINGNKLDETSQKLLADIKIAGLHVMKGNSGEADDPSSRMSPIETVDISLDSSVQTYLALKQEEERVMEEAVNLSRVALGQQSSTIGKGVQANTIAQNSYGTAPIFWGLMKHFEKVLQYNLDKKQLLYTLDDTIEESLTIGDEGTVLLKILDPKEFGTQQFKLSIELNNALSEQERQEIKAIAQAAAQNRELTLLDYVKHIVRKQTPTEMIRGLELSMTKAKQEAAKIEQAASDRELQMTMQVKEMEQKYQVMYQQLKDDNASFRTVIQKLEGLPEIMQMIQDMMPPQSPLQLVNSEGMQQGQQQMAEAQQAQQAQE